MLKHLWKWIGRYQGPRRLAYERFPEVREPRKVYWHGKRLWSFRERRNGSFRDQTE
jgi:hypothetical protein